MRRKRRTKYTWLPAFGTGLTVSGIGNYEASPRFGSTVVRRDDGVSTTIIECVPDISPENFDASSLLTEAIAQEYILRRIVGKLLIGYQQNGEAYAAGVPAIPQGCLVTAGFFVARSNDVSSGETLPIGLSASATATIADFENYSPLARDTQREPWIWRRTWQLGNNLDALVSSVPNATTDGEGLYPPNNARAGSVLDGPHIDAKTLRRIGNDNRLWFAISAVQMHSTTQAAQNSEINWVLDVRYLGALRRARQRGAF